MIDTFSVAQSNSINRKYQAVQMQYGQVETVLQRRYDLLPNLTSAVKGSMKQEQKVFAILLKHEVNIVNSKINAKIQYTDTEGQIITKDASN